MFAKFKPDFYFDHYTSITPSWLKEREIKFILSDLDGTLASQDQNGAAEFEAWYRSIEKVGTALIVVSNNTQERVDEFIQPFKLVGYGECQKPFATKIEKELFEKGLNPKTTMFLGDQVFTDVWCGKQLGVQTALVQPIEGKEPLRTKIKRPLEKILLKRWGLL